MNHFGGKGLLFISAKVPSAAMLFAQSANFLLIPVVCAPTAVILYYIFSQTLGTLKKNVLELINLLRSTYMQEFDKIALQS